MNGAPARSTVQIAGLSGVAVISDMAVSEAWLGSLIPRAKSWKVICGWTTCDATVGNSFFISCLAERSVRECQVKDAPKPVVYDGRLSAPHGAPPSAAAL